MIVSLVRFRSALSDDEVQATFEDRADGYLSVPGLVEKIYLRYRGPGEYGAVYVWSRSRRWPSSESPISAARSATRTESTDRRDPSSRTFAWSFGRRPMIQSSRRSCGIHGGIDRGVRPAGDESDLAMWHCRFEEEQRSAGAARSRRKRKRRLATPTARWSCGQRPLALTDER